MFAVSIPQLISNYKCCFLQLRCENVDGFHTMYNLPNVDARGMMVHEFWVKEGYCVKYIFQFARITAFCLAGEVLAAVLPPEKTRRWWGLAAALSVFVVADVYFRGEPFAGTPIQGLMPWLTAAQAVVVFICMVLEYGKKEEMDFTALCAILIAGVAIPMALTCLLRLRMLEHGAGLVLIPLVAAFMSDTMALFGGMLFGKTKLAPLVSPKKTREGAVSGLVGGMAGMILFRIFFFLCTEVQLHIGWCVLLGLVGSVLGQLGDLSFSCIKRQYGIKDYGRLLPGHGGVLDRFDSVIFAAPVLWMIVDAVKLY